MKLTLALSFALLPIMAQTPSSPSVNQNSSGLKVLSLQVKKVKYPSRSSIVSQQPPVLKPDLGRGYDINEPELIRINKDRADREKELRALRNINEDATTRSSMVRLYFSRLQLKNNTSKSVVSFVWAFKASPKLQLIRDQEFLCQVKILPGQVRKIKASSPYPSQKVVNVSTTVSNPIPEQPSLADVIINKVIFSDGSVWQRPDWDAKALSSPMAPKATSGKCILL